ncbi:hypothetical protein PS704_05896 [Pseudomonas fluorescens]|uniref:Uncharacterized protein n=1 Tax=Pseudomonas fluorescens TaxID=294 RepID=A0A5E7FQF8_PSEFL|nr:hypothetical protein PS704_05896 [Pseudomonas fluorescens]
MVVPLPDLRHFSVEATDVVVHQVVAVIAAILIEGFGDFALGIAGDVAPHATIFGGQLRRDRTVGVDGVAAVDKEIWQAQTHGFIDAHAANVRVDAEALADGVAAPDKADVAPGLRHAAQVTEPGFAGDATLSVFEMHAIENRLVGGQTGELDPRGEIAAGIRQWRDKTPRVAEQTAGVPFHHHPRRTIAAAPDHRPVAQHVAGLHAIGELRPVLDRRNHRRREAGKQNPGADRLYDTTATEVEFAHGVLPEKGKLKHDRVNRA